VGARARYLQGSHSKSDPNPYKACSSGVSTQDPRKDWGHQKIIIRRKGHTKFARTTRLHPSRTSVTAAKNNNPRRFSSVFSFTFTFSVFITTSEPQPQTPFPIPLLFAFPGTAIAFSHFTTLYPPNPLASPSIQFEETGSACFRLNFLPDVSLVEFQASLMFLAKQFN